MGHAKTPQIPEVTDEAGDSSKWLPLYGAVLFAGAVGWLVWAHTCSSTAEAETEAAPAEVAPSP
jgi:hypothetical protein